MQRVTLTIDELAQAAIQYAAREVVIPNGTSVRVTIRVKEGAQIDPESPTSAPGATLEWSEDVGPYR